MAMNGADVLLYVNTGTDLAPNYEVIGSQRDFTLNETTAEIDVSSKDQREMRVLPGRYDSTITLGALYVPTDNAYLTLLSAMRNGTAITVRISEEGADVEEADAIVTALNRAGPDQDATTISVTLRIDGAWTTLGT
jgi:predicted secreted protein